MKTIETHVHQMRKMHPDDKSAEDAGSAEGAEGAEDGPPPCSLDHDKRRAAHLVALKEFMVWERLQPTRLRMLRKLAARQEAKRASAVVAAGPPTTPRQ